MVFVSAHYKSEDQFLVIANQLEIPLENILFCGSTEFHPILNTTIPYHPLMQVVVNQEVDIKAKHAFLDTLMRAIQIEVPDQYISFGKTFFDNETILEKTKAHCKIVGVELI
jgi:hypothetical protein